MMGLDRFKAIQIANTPVNRDSIIFDVFGPSEAPEKGAGRMAKVAATRLGIDYDYLEKTRHGGTEVSMALKEIV